MDLIVELSFHIFSSLTSKHLSIIEHIICTKRLMHTYKVEQEILSIFEIRVELSPSRDVTYLMAKHVLLQSMFPTL